MASLDDDVLVCYICVGTLFFFRFHAIVVRKTMAATMKKHLSEKAQMHGLKELVAHVANESRIQIDEDREER